MLMMLGSSLGVVLMLLVVMMAQSVSALNILPTEVRVIDRLCLRATSMAAIINAPSEKSEPPMTTETIGDRR